MNTNNLPANLIEIIHNGQPTTGPSKVSLQITDHCNLHCEYCLQHSPLKKPHHPLGPVAVSRILAIIEELTEAGTKELCLLGQGEPSTHPSFLKIVQAIKRAGIHLTIYTNLSLRTAGAIAGYVFADRLLVNLSAVDEHAYLSIHAPASSKAFSNVLSNIAALKKKNNSNIQVSFIITQNNFRMISAAIDLLRNSGASAVFFKNPIILPETKSLLLNKQEHKELILLLAEELRRIKGFRTNLKDVLKERLTPQRTSAPFNRCFMTWLTLSIAQKGEMTLCCRDRMLNIGTWKKGSLAKIWTGPKAQRFRLMGRDDFKNNKLFGPNCQYCSYAQLNAQIQKECHYF